jgi:hypothetical protein
MTKKFTDFYEAWVFLNEHHYFEHGEYKMPMFTESMDIAVVKVNPETKHIDDDESKNTETQVWVECGDWEELPDHDFKGYVHDMDLDTGGATFEEAIVNLANLLYEKRGENPPGYGEMTPEEEEEINAKFDAMLNSMEEVPTLTASVTFERKDTEE